MITGGFNVYPKEVEGEIDALRAWWRAPSSACRTRISARGVTAVIVRTSGATLTEAQVHAALEEKLAKFKLPKKVFFVDELPRNTMGKLQKNVLRDTYKKHLTPPRKRPGAAERAAPHSSGPRSEPSGQPGGNATQGRAARAGRKEEYAMILSRRHVLAGAIAAPAVLSFARLGTPPPR